MDGQVVVQEGVLPLVAGLGLGLAYFLGLWWTTQRVGRAGPPGLLLMGSFAVRMSALLGGLWLVTGGRMVATAVFMAGVMAARQAVLAWAQRAARRGR